MSKWHWLLKEETIIEENERIILKYEFVKNQKYSQAKWMKKESLKIRIIKRN